MDKVVVTTICSLGVVLAFSLVLVWRDTTAAAATGIAGDEPLRTRLVEGLRVASAVSAAGVVGGVLTFGLGGRLMMRVLAATSPDATGFITDAEERVGEVTTGGTIGLVMFLGLFTTLPTGVYVLSRRWFPKRSVAAGLLAGGIGGGLLVRPSGLLDPENRDFHILSPTWLAVLLCVGLVVLGSMTVAILVDRWTGTWTTPSLTWRGSIALLPLVVYLIPPVTAVGLGLVASRVFVFQPDRASRLSLVTAVGRRLTTLAGIAGGAWTLFAAAEILS